MKFLATSVTCFLLSFSVFAQSECGERYTCEKAANGSQTILRLTELVKDENLTFCSTVTVANYGTNSSECAKTAALLNAR